MPPVIFYEHNESCAMIRAEASARRDDLFQRIFDLEEKLLQLRMELTDLNNSLYRTNTIKGSDREQEY